MSFLGEIKRRKVFQVAAVYAVVAWLLIQVITSIETPLNLPDWVDTLVIVLLAIGFPITLIVSWAFNLTPEGLVREDSAAPATSHSRKIEYALIGLVVVALGWLVYRVEFDAPMGAGNLPVPDAGTVEERSTVAPDDILPNSIAVLPFANQSPDPDNDYLAAGIYQSTVNQLGKISDLTVIARTSVLQFEKNPPPIPEIAKALKVAAVMEGSVQYANGQVLITAQLVDGRTGRQIWSDQFKRQLTDVFAVQAEVAEQIAAALEVRLLPEEQLRIAKQPTNSVEAYRYYLRSLSMPSPMMFPDVLPLHVDLLNRAILADPQFAEAYSQLAWIYYNSTERNRAVEYAERAIAIDPMVGQSYFVLGMRDRYYYNRQESARVAFERAIELSPKDPSTLMFAYRHLSEQSGEYEDAIRLGKDAIEFDPNAGSLHWNLGFILMRARDFAGAVEQFQESVRIEPEDWVNLLDLAHAQYLMGNRIAAMENLNRLTHLLPPGTTFRVDYLAYLYGLLGEPERAATLLAEQGASPDDPQSDVWETLGWAVLGTRDKEQSLQVWAATIDGYINDNKPVSLGRITRFRDNWLDDPMLEEPEFLELRRRLGFKG
jgi:TolB-like protein/Tfp pilus assembly protein PilF